MTHPLNKIIGLVSKKTNFVSDVISYIDHYRVAMFVGARM